MRLRDAPVLLTLLALLLAGCAAPLGAPAGTPRNATAPTGDDREETPCLRVTLAPERDTLRVYEPTVLQLHVANCGPVTLLLLDAEACDALGVGSLKLVRGDEVAWLPGDLSARTDHPGAEACGGEPAPRFLAPGEAWQDATGWNGTVQDRPADPGSYQVLLDVEDANGHAWRGEANLTLLPAAVPPHDARADVVFLLEETYAQGERVEVRVRNVGGTPYAHRTRDAACDLQYYTDEGRPFLVPPGTGCDSTDTATLASGEEVVLFSWDLDECIVDRWGCVEAEALPPGTYHLRGAFHPIREGEVDWSRATLAGASLTIRA